MVIVHASQWLSVSSPLWEFLCPIHMLTQIGVRPSVVRTRPITHVTNFMNVSADPLSVTCAAIPNQVLRGLVNILFQSTLRCRFVVINT